jgi:diguanylate cyclase (GGDEF)-like protein/PAS domain S-box-containing protein
VAYVAIVDTQSTVLALHFKEAFSNQENEAATSVKRSSTEKLNQLSTRSDIHQSEFSIRFSGNDYGQVLLGLTSAHLLERLHQQFLRHIYFTFLLVVLLGVGIYWLSNRQIFEPVRQLMEGSKRISEGNLQEPIPFSSKDELGMLGLAFNDMMGELKREQEEISNSHQKLEHQYKLQQQLIDAVAAPIFLKDRGGRYVACNRAFENATGLPVNRIIGRSVEDVAPATDKFKSTALHSRIRSLDQKVMESGKPLQEEVEIVYADGAVHVVVVNKNPVFDGNGNITGLVGVYLDVTERKDYERKLEKINARLEERVSQRTRELESSNQLLEKTNAFLQSVIDMVPYPTLVIDMEDYTIEMSNKSARDAYLDSKALPPGITCYKLSHKFDQPCSGTDEPCPLQIMRETGEPSTVIHRHFSNDYSELFVEVSSTPIIDSSGRITHVIESHRDITDYRRREAELKYQATTDELTGALNRRGFEQVLDDCLTAAVRSGQSPGIIMMDIDHFKQVNDRFGHGIGDTVLRQAVEVVHRHLRGSDVIGRWGGEEFVILLPDARAENLPIIADELRLSLANHRFGTMGQVTASFGVTAFHTGEGSDELIKRADDALYEAKAAGRNRVISRID